MRNKIILQVEIWYPEGVSPPPVAITAMAVSQALENATHVPLALGEYDVFSGWTPLAKMCCAAVFEGSTLMAQVGNPLDTEPLNPAPNEQN